MQRNQMPQEIQRLVTRGEELYGRDAFARIYAQFQALQPFMTDPAASLGELVTGLEAQVTGDTITITTSKEAAMRVFLQYLNTDTPYRHARRMPFAKQRIRALGPTLAQLLADRVSLVQKVSQSQGVIIGPNDLLYHVVEALEKHNLVQLEHNPDWPPNVGTNVYGRKVFTGQPELGPKPGYDPITLPPNRK